MPRVTKSSPGSAPVGVISKVLLILEALQGSSAGLGLKAICDQTSIHKSTAHRFLKHLERERYLWELWKSTQETVNLAVLDQGTVLYVDVIESPHEFRLSSRVGTRRSLHVTALGKALAAFLPAEPRENILSTIAFQPSTPRTILNLLQFRQELEKIRRQGYAVDDEEAVQGARCVSAPILNSDREPIAAVSVSGPVTRVSPSQVAVLAGAVTSAARTISAAMGFSQSEMQIVDRRHHKKVVPARN